MMETHALLVGVPLLLVAILSVVIFGRHKSPHPASYSLSEKWTDDPILWTSTENVGGGAHHGHGAHEVSVGGGASGKW